MYSLDAGLSYELPHGFSLMGGLGGFRSAVSFPGSGPRRESLSGPLLYGGAEYRFRDEGSTVRPVASLVAGYRLAIPMESEEPLYDVDAPDGVTDYRYVPLVKTDGVRSGVTRQVTPDGPFLRAGIGTDIRIGEVILNVSLTGELSDYYTGAFVKGSAERFGKGASLRDGTPAFRAGRAPFGERLRGAAGIAVKVRL